MDYGDWRLGPQQLAEALKAPAPQMAAPELAGYWKKTWEGAASEPEIFTVDNLPYGPDVKGWTACDKDRRHCQIMLLRNADRDCVEAHERKHAAGFDHPDYPRAYICK